MKFSSSILALCALSADAFTAQAPKRASFGLFSSPEGSAFPSASKAASAAPPAPKKTSGTSALSTYTKPRTTDEIFTEADTINVQGGSLKTCSFNQEVDRMTVFMKTDGRPLNANVDLWQGPDNTPQKMSVYLEDGSIRPFRCTIECPGASNSVAIRNTGQLEFPLIAGLEPDMEGNDVGPADALAGTSETRVVQGGAVYTTPFPPAVQSVEVMLKSDGRPVNARIELLQGPNNNKQVMEIYSEDGNTRPFYCVIDTPGTGNVIRIVNTATVEFPLFTSLEPYMVDEVGADTGSSSPGGMLWS